MKRAILAVVAIFIALAILDFIIHGLLLQSTYEATANLWRSMEEINALLMYVVTLVYAICFVAIYGLMVSEKSVASGTKFGTLFGLAAGVSMGFGSYCYMPIPFSLALSWFVGILVELIVAGVLVGAIMRPLEQTT